MIVQQLLKSILFPIFTQVVIFCVTRVNYDGFIDWYIRFIYSFNKRGSSLAVVLTDNAKFTIFVYLFIGLDFTCILRVFTSINDISSTIFFFFKSTLCSRQ